MLARTGEQIAPCGAPSSGHVQRAVLQVARLQPLLDLPSGWKMLQLTEKVAMVDVVICSTDVGIQHPLVGQTCPQEAKQVLDGIVGAPPWSEPIAARFEPRLPAGFQGCLDHMLADPIGDGGDA